jgi:hypothetical protein
MPSELLFVENWNQPMSKLTVVVSVELFAVTCCVRSVRTVFVKCITHCADLMTCVQNIFGIRAVSRVEDSCSVTNSNSDRYCVQCISRCYPVA